MSSKPAKQIQVQCTKGVLTSQSESNRATEEFNRAFSKSRKHSALKGSPTVVISASQWNSINEAIVETVDSILAQNITLNSLGPDYWEMDEGYGVALVAEIRRAIKETCTLTNPRLQKEIRKMASDVTRKEFRFPYKGGGVWFYFKMTDLQKATKFREAQEQDIPPIVDNSRKENVEDKEKSGVKKDKGDEI